MSTLNSPDSENSLCSACPGPTNDELRSAEVVANIVRASHRLRTLLTSHFAEFGLTDVRYSVLQIVDHASSDGCSQTKLAAELQQSESSVSTLVERMRDSGLLYRLQSNQDRRKRDLILTELGRETLARVGKCHAKRTAQLMQCFDSPQMQQLLTLLQTMVTELSNRQPSDIHRTDRNATWQTPAA